jgi:hypothetical protein
MSTMSILAIMLDTYDQVRYMLVFLDGVQSFGVEDGL